MKCGVKLVWKLYQSILKFNLPFRILLRWHSRPPFSYFVSVTEGHHQIIAFLELPRDQFWTSGLKWSDNDTTTAPKAALFVAKIKSCKGHYQNFSKNTDPLLLAWKTDVESSRHSPKYGAINVFWPVRCTHYDNRGLSLEEKRVTLRQSGEQYNNSNCCDNLFLRKIYFPIFLHLLLIIRVCFETRSI